MAGEPIPLPGFATLPRDLPVRGVAVGGTDADFQLNGETVDYVRRPPGLAKVRDAFAIYVVGDSMSPRFEEGELLFINPHRPARPGDDVLIEMKPNGHEAGDAFIKRLVKRTPTQWVCRQFNPPAELSYPVAEVKHVLRIMSGADLLGV